MPVSNSKSLGRVVGFFDEEQVFQVVLLDPLHNLQPSGAHNYRVDPSSPLSCDYTQLREDVLAAAKKATCAEEAQCPVKKILATIDAKPEAAFNLVVMTPQDDAVETANELMTKNQVSSYEEIFETGVYYALDHPKVSG
jgi:hypothetical protein